MRRIDIISIGVGIFAFSGLVFVILQAAGLDAASSGIWTQSVLVLGLMGWLITYVSRAVTGSMTYHQQRQDYEEAVLQKRLDELTPEELARLQAEVEQEKQAKQAANPKA